MTSLALTRSVLSLCFNRINCKQHQQEDTTCLYFISIMCAGGTLGYFTAPTFVVRQHQTPRQGLQSSTVIYLPAVYKQTNFTVWRIHYFVHFFIDIHITITWKKCRQSETSDFSFSSLVTAVATPFTTRCEGKPGCWSRIRVVLLLTNTQQRAADTKIVSVCTTCNYTLESTQSQLCFHMYIDFIYKPVHQTCTHIAFIFICIYCS